MKTDTDKKAPDYGEPWWKRGQYTVEPILDREGDAVDEDERAIECVNACAGMADPAAEIAELRRERDELQAMLLKEKQWHIKLVRAVADEREEQFSKVTTERDEARAELAEMREAIKEAHAALSAHNHTNGCCCDACHAMNGAHPRHDDLCVNTQSALTKLKPFLK